MLSLDCSFQLATPKYDIKNAFIHGDLDEEICMNILLGIEEDTGKKVCKVRRALYGLKQSL